MKNKGYFLIGVFLLFALLPMVLAGGETWVSYGNGYFPAHQSQYETGYSFFDGIVNTQTSTYSGQDQFFHPTQPLVASFGGTDVYYTIVADGGYLRIFDGNLNFYAEHYVGMSSMGQLGAIDWNSDGHVDVAGYWRENATSIHFKVFEIDHNSQLFSEIYDYNFTHPATNGVTGVRCDGDTCYTILYDTAGVGTSTYWIDLQISKTTGVLAHLLYSIKQPYIPIEPPSFDDYNNDGLMDFLVFSEDNVAVYNEMGTILANWTFRRGFGDNQYVKSAKFFNADVSPHLRVAIVTEVPFQSNSDDICFFDVCVVVYGKNIQDRTQLFNKECMSGNYNDDARLQGFAIKDYNRDGYDDIWCSGSRLGSTKQGVLYIFKGDGTSVLYVSGVLGTDYGAVYPSSSMTLARMDSDSSYDAIIYADGKIRVWSPAKNEMIYSSSLNVTSGQGSCIPADLNYNGALDLLCVDTNSMEFISSNISNQNAYITQVAYDPSVLVAVNQTLTAVITAVDPESDNILYVHKCNPSDNWSNEDGSNARECVYDAVGTYILVVGVRDPYHPNNYDVFPQTITITSTGSICDNDYVCESGQGETYLTCPNDCLIPEEEEIPETTTSTGGTPLPTSLVDVSDVNKGLLPEIYYGTLAFMSSIISPTILVVFVIFFAMIMLTIGAIIRKIAQRVSESGR
jgi:hypothetical protein